MLNSQLEKKIKRLEEEIERLTRERLTLIKMCKRLLLFHSK